MAYGYYRSVTVDYTKVAATLTDYPVLVSATLAELATVANGGKVQSASGYDIVFAPNTDGSSKYDFEIEKWSATTGEIVAWVRIPSLSSTVDTVFYLVYGDAGVVSSQQNATGVWDANFRLVAHLNDTNISGAWTTKTAITNAVADCPAVPSGGLLYVFGGYGSNSGDVKNYVQIYDPAGNSWSQGTVMTTARWGAAAAELSGVVYVFGGRTTASTPSAKCEAYNIAGDSWATLNDLPAALTEQGLMAVASGTKIYLFYGLYTYEFDPTGDGGNGTYTLLTSSNPVSRVWATCAAVTVGGEDRIYVIGGCNIAGSIAYASNYYFKPATSLWSAAQTPAPYTAYGVLRDNPVDGGLIYYGFGQWPTGTYHTTLYTYDPATDTWSAPLPHAVYARDGVGCGFISNKLYVVGGRAGTPGLNYNEEFNPAGTSAMGLSDSTSHAHVGQKKAVGAPALATGKVGSGQDFATGDYATFPDSADWDFAGDYTLEVWVNPDAADAELRLLAHYDDSSRDGYYLAQGPTGSGVWYAAWFVNGTAKTISSTTVPSVGNWTYLVFTRASGVGSLYVNATAEGGTQTLAGAMDASGVLHLAEAYNQLYRFAGLLDEIRISGVARSADWITTTHNNQSNPGTFETIGAETPAGGSVPADPTGLTATANGSTQIDLAWTDNSGDETGFRIERSPNGSTWSLVYTTAADAESWSNTGLSPNTTYYYRVYAYNASGASDYTNTASATTSPGTSLTAQRPLVWDGTQIKQADLRYVVFKNGAPTPDTVTGYDWVYFDIADGLLKIKHSDGSVTLIGNGDVVGPATNTDNAIARFNGADSKTIQNSLATVDDSGGINIPTGQTYNINSSPHTHAFGITHTYYGYNTVGGSQENMPLKKVYFKKITLAAAGTLTGISAYIRHNGDYVIGYGASVLTDNSNAPNQIIASSGLSGATDLLLSKDAVAEAKLPRWLHLPVTIYLAAGDYWISFGAFYGADNRSQIYYDGSGSDQVHTEGGVWMSDGARYTLSNTTNKYSIRASVLT